MAKIVRLTESDLTRLVKRVIMEAESSSYHLFVDSLDEIEKEDMKKKNLTDEDLDDIREDLERDKKSVKDSDLTEIEKKRLNRRINSLITKLKGMYNSDSRERMRVKPRIGMDESDLTRIVKRVIQEQRIASFDDEFGWYDEEDRPVKPEDFGNDYDEEEFDEFEPMMAKHGKNQKWFNDTTQDKFGHGDGKKMFDTYREKTGKPFRVRSRRKMD